MRFGMIPIKVAIFVLTFVLIASLIPAVVFARSQTTAPFPSASDPPPSPPLTQTALTQAQFHDLMRKLWEDHIFWTHLTVVSLMAGWPDTKANMDRLLQNQVDIGNAFKPFYGAAAGSQLTALLQTHIKTAGDVLTALKDSDRTKYNAANVRWHSNAYDIAAFWNSINPAHWPLDQARDFMKVHLDQILADANARIKQDWAGDITIFDAANNHILMMADFLSSGITRQFPRRFMAS